MNNQTSVVTDNSGIKTETTKGSVTVDKVGVSPNFQKEGSISAQLRQVIKTKTTYPAKRMTSSMDDALFTPEAFGLGEGQSYDGIEQRVHWLNIPIGTTAEQVQAMLDPTTATIVKHLSNRPILSAEQQNSIERGLKTIDDYANTQMVRYPANTMKGNVNVGGQIILDPNGKVQYRATSFSKNIVEDNDKRNADMTDQYISPEIQAELTGAGSVYSAQNL